MFHTIIKGIEFALASAGLVLGTIVTVEIASGKEDHYINPGQLQFWQILLVACVFVGPSLLILLGAFLQIRRGRPALGRLLICLASFFLMLVFALFLTAGYAGNYLIAERLFLVLFSLLTVITCFFVRRGIKVGA